MADLKKAKDFMFSKLKRKGKEQQKMDEVNEILAELSRLTQVINSGKSSFMSLSSKNKQIIIDSCQTEFDRLAELDRNGSLTAEQKSEYEQYKKAFSEVLNLEDPSKKEENQKIIDKITKIINTRKKDLTTLDETLAKLAEELKSNSGPFKIDNFDNCLGIYFKDNFQLLTTLKTIKGKEARIKDLQREYKKLNGKEYSITMESISSIVSKHYEKIYIELSATILALTSKASTLKTDKERQDNLNLIEKANKALGELNSYLTEEERKSLQDGCKLRVETRRQEIEKDFGLVKEASDSKLDALKQELTKEIEDAVKECMDKDITAITSCHIPSDKIITELEGKLTSISNDEKYAEIPQSDIESIVQSIYDKYEPVINSYQPMFEEVKEINEKINELLNKIATIAKKLNTIDFKNPDALSTWESIIKEISNEVANQNTSYFNKMGVNISYEPNSSYVMLHYDTEKFKMATDESRTIIAPELIAEYQKAAAATKTAPKQDAEAKKQALSSLKTAAVNHYILEYQNLIKNLKCYQEYTIKTLVASEEILKVLTPEEINQVINEIDSQTKASAIALIGEGLYNSLNKVIIAKKELESSPEYQYFQTTSVDTLTIEDYEKNYNLLQQRINALTSLSEGRLIVACDEATENLKIEVKNGLSDGFQLPISMTLVPNELKNKYNELVASKKQAPTPEEPVKDENKPGESKPNPSEEHPDELTEIDKKYMAEYEAMYNELNKTVDLLNNTNAAIEIDANAEIKSANLIERYNPLMQDDLGQISNTIKREKDAQMYQESIREYQVRIAELRVKYTNETGKYITMIPEMKALTQKSERFSSELNAFIEKRDTLTIIAELEINERTAALKSGNLSEQEQQNIQNRIQTLMEFIGAQNSLINRRILSEVALHPDLNVIDILNQRRENKKALYSQVEQQYQEYYATKGKGDTPSQPTSEQPDVKPQPVVDPNPKVDPQPEADSKKPEDTGTKKETKPKSNKKAPKAQEIKFGLTPKFKNPKIDRARNTIISNADSITVEVIKNGLRIRLAQNVSEMLKELQTKVSLLSKQTGKEKGSAEVTKDGIAELHFEHNIKPDNYYIKLQGLEDGQELEDIYAADIEKIGKSR